MALIPVSTKTPSASLSKRQQFESRLKLIAQRIPGIKYKDKLVLGYTAWRLMCDYLVIRTYKDRYTLHTNGDIEHYESKEAFYEDVKYECDDLQFIANLLENKI